MRKIKPKTDKYMLSSGPSKLSKAESKPIFPTIRLDLEHIPEAKDWKIGKTYRIEMVVKMTGISQSRYDNSSEFEIHQIEADNKAPKDEEPNDESNE